MENQDNNGLADIITFLDTLYVGRYDQLMSRADYWQLAAIAGIEMGVSISNIACFEDYCMTPMPNIEFRMGREDCETSPYTRDWNIFPPATLTRKQMMQYFDEMFDFNEEEVVAIMGAHTLGRAVRENSGYSGKWKVNETLHFNTKFYSFLINDHVWFKNNITYSKFVRSSCTKKIGISIPPSCVSFKGVLA